MSDTDICVDRIPRVLRDLPRWVGWRYVVRDGEETKCPINATSGKPAKSTDPATWTTFEAALAAYRTDSLAGVGFVFTREDGFAGVDLDDAVDATTGALKPWAREIVEDIDSYTEISPSGQGVKVFLQATKPGSRCRKAYHDGEVEIYDADRFFTVTGRWLPDVSEEVEQRQAELERLYTTVFGEETAPAPPKDTPPPSSAPRLTDAKILDLARSSRTSGEKFRALYDAGDWNAYFNSPSEADASVVFTLAFYTKDPVQLDRLFRNSQLHRDKWDEPRGEKTYGQVTIEKALANVTGQYRGRRKRRRKAAGADTTDPTSPAPGDTPVPLGQRDPATGLLVLSTKRTLPTAEAYVREMATHVDGRTLHSYAGLLMEWQGNRYVEVEDEAIKNRLQPWLHGAVHYVWNRQLQDHVQEPFPANPQTIKAALDSVRTYTHLPASHTPPLWLSDASDKPEPREILAGAFLNLHIPTGEVFPATPALFNTNSLEFDYDPDAAVPEQWLTFLGQLWDDDAESIDLLQEWFGYCLTADTSQQKMLLLVGPKRSGKGTIGRVLTHLIGAGNVVGPTTSSLAGPFGLQPLIGRSLAIVSDARFRGSDIPIVTERLLCISGEDAMTVDRKYIGAVTMKLPTRFMFLANELPRFNDASGALAGRFLVLRFTESFYGREDRELTAKLLTELPGILLWALQGWERLHRRGRFEQPASAEDAIRDLEDLTSPVGAFIRDRCVVGLEYTVEAAELFREWKEYCHSIGRDRHGTVQTFGRDLRAAVPMLKVRQPRAGGARLRWYVGIGLARDAEDGGMP